MSGKKIKRNFYERPTLTVSQEILGKYIVFNSNEGKKSARIVEVEAYMAEDDPACHAHRGMTTRNKPLFGTPGFSYVYFIYGMYFCFNFVTEPKGRAAAVLLRGAEPCEGVDLMRKNVKAKNNYQLLNGPGKLCRSFGFTLDHNLVDLTGDLIYLEDRNHTPVNICKSSRIGISSAREKMWRFFDLDSKSVSGNKNNIKVESV